MTGLILKNPDTPGIRLDKWLWYARFLKSRTSASKLCSGGNVRINSQRTLKAHSLVRVGDVLTFPQGNKIRVVQIIQLGKRRGPAAEAEELYSELESTESTEIQKELIKKHLGGRPTKKDRRDIERFKNPQT